MTTVLFIMYGDPRGINHHLQRLIKLKYLTKDKCFTDLNYLQGTNAIHFRGTATHNASITVTDLLDTDHKARSIQKSLLSVYDSILIVENTPTIGQITTDEDFKHRVNSGIQLSDKRLSTDDRLNLLTTMRKASKTRYSSIQA